MSSYTPSITALRTAEYCQPTQFQGVLAVSQPSTPYQHPLPATIKEVDAVQLHSTSTQFARLDGAQATVQSVLEEMGKKSWVHLACHASQCAKDPRSSAFLLDDGPLELRQIMEKSFEHAELAFLSACQTASGDDELPEEAVHLAAGMMAAGYRSVIATMWSIRDSDAPLVVDKFYSDLLWGSERVKVERAPFALHEAVKDLRNKVGVTEFARWVPFIHMGH